jgi:hypothetical protein
MTKEVILGAEPSGIIHRTLEFSKLVVSLINDRGGSSESQGQSNDDWAANGTRVAQLRKADLLLTGWIALSHSWQGLLPIYLKQQAAPGVPKGLFDLIDKDGRKVVVGKHPCKL